MGDFPGSSPSGWADAALGWEHKGTRPRMTQVGELVHAGRSESLQY